MPQNINCCFLHKNKCTCLVITPCPIHCKFFKTSDDFERLANQSSKILEKKNLKVVITNDGTQDIISTEKIEV